MTIYCSAVVGQVVTFLEDDTSGAALFSGAVNPGTPEWFGLYGALVFEPGEGFHFQVNALPTDAADVYAGGYVLDLP